MSRHGSNSAKPEPTGKTCVAGVRKGDQLSVRRKVVVKGALQGVTYLKQTQRIAHDLGVSGWVRNGSNGDVEACFEGDESAVYALLAWCFVGPKRARVEQVVIRPSRYRGRFKELSIRDERLVE